MTANGEHGEHGEQVAITKAIRATLRAELRRSGVTAIQLLKNARDLPAGLTARSVNRWMAGLAASAPRAHVDYVTARWAKLPDDPGRVASDGRKLSKRGARHPAHGEEWIDLTDVMIAQLRAEFARTGVKVAAILRNVEGAPPGLNQRVVRGWYYGEIGRANAAHWRFALAHLAALPDQPGT